MGNIKQINIKYRTFYFSNDIINSEEFDSNLLKIDKRSNKNIGIYNIGYTTIKNGWFWKYSRCKSFVSDHW